MSRFFMKYNRKKRRVIILCLLFGVTISVIVYGCYGWKKSKREVCILQEQLDLYERMVYVAAEKLPRGTILTKDKLDMQIRYSDYPEEAFISEKELGMTVSLDIEEGTCLMDFMVCESEDRTREFYLDGLEIPEHVQKGDRVDIRIRYGNAEEYIVLANKIIINCHSDDGVVICLTEEEFLMISSAVTDTELFRKAKLYLVEYPEYVELESSRINYIANKDVLLLLGREKTEGESRNALEKRLMQSVQ